MITPSLGLKGIFTFSSPFKELLNTDQEFTIIAIRTIHDLIVSGIDPLSTIYIPVGLTVTDYNEDIKNNTPMITLATNGNEQVTIPSSYIEGYPDASFIKYQGKALTIDLNYLPLTYDLESLISDIKDTIYNRMAITVDVEIVNTTPITYKSPEVDEAIQRLMENKPAVDRSWMTRYYESQSAIENLMSEISILKDKIAKDKEIYDKLASDYIDLKNKYDDCCESE